MDRLTFEGNFCDIALCFESPCPHDNNCSQRQVWERLKEYEDAEEQGRLTVLPCKVGGTVWFETYKNGEPIGIKPHKVEAIRVLVRLEKGYGEPTTEIPDWEFGKTVFLSREEAERVLKGESK